MEVLINGVMVPVPIEVEAEGGAVLAAWIAEQKAAGSSPAPKKGKPADAPAPVPPAASDAATEGTGGAS